MKRLFVAMVLVLTTTSLFAGSVRPLPRDFNGICDSPECVQARYDEWERLAGVCAEAAGKPVYGSFRACACRLGFIWSWAYGFNAESVKTNANGGRAMLEVGRSAGCTGQKHEWDIER
jgi:hypothetical protein